MYDPATVILACLMMLVLLTVGGGMLIIGVREFFRTIFLDASIRKSTPNEEIEATLEREKSTVTNLDGTPLDDPHVLNIDTGNMSPEVASKFVKEEMANFWKRKMDEPKEDLKDGMYDPNQLLEVYDHKHTNKEV